MATRTTRQALLLAALVAVLAAVLWWDLAGGPAPAAPTTAATRPGARRQKPAVAAGVEDVALDALSRPRPETAASDRNPFRFKPRHAPPPPPGDPASTDGAGGGQRDAGGVQASTGPPPPPPIPLKFIGVIEQAEQHRKLAALSDGRFTYYGREGDIIEGRYRIVRIGVESIEMVHVDGRGAQTIRLSGS